MKKMILAAALLGSLSSFAELSTNVRCNVKLSPVGLGSVQSYSLDGEELHESDAVDFQTFTVNSTSSLKLITNEGVEIVATPRVYVYPYVSRLVVEVKVKENSSQTGYASLATKVGTSAYRFGESLDLEGQFHVQNRNSAYPSVNVTCGTNI